MTMVLKWTWGAAKAEATRERITKGVILSQRVQSILPRYIVFVYLWICVFAHLCICLLVTIKEFSQCYTAFYIVILPCSRLINQITKRIGTWIDQKCPESICHNSKFGRKFTFSKNSSNTKLKNREPSPCQESTVKPQLGRSGPLFPL